MLVLSVAGVSLLVVFYLYVRTEALRRELAVFRRQLSNLCGDVKNMDEVIEVLAFEQQATLRKKIAQAKNFGHPDANLIKYTEALTDSIVNVTVESAKGHKNVSEAFKKQLAKTTDISFDDFNKFISDQDDSVKSEWHKKTIMGYLTMCQRLVENLSGLSGAES